MKVQKMWLDEATIFDHTPSEKELQDHYAQKNQATNSQTNSEGVKVASVSDNDEKRKKRNARQRAWYAKNKSKAARDYKDSDQKYNDNKNAKETEIKNKFVNPFAKDKNIQKLDNVYQQIKTSNNINDWQKLYQQAVSAI